MPGHKGRGAGDSDAARTADPRPDRELRGSHVRQVLHKGPAMLGGRRGQQVGGFDGLSDTHTRFAVAQDARGVDPFPAMNRNPMNVGLRQHGASGKNAVRTCFIL